MYEPVVRFYLTYELIDIFKRSQRVGVGLRQKFHATCGSQLFQQVDKLRYILLQLLYGCAGNRNGAFEFSSALLNHSEQGAGHRHIAAFGYARDDIVVGEVVIIIMIIADIEEAVSFQPVRLVYLEIEAN